ncbi:DeoR/GlpR family DNA-binding transcription regulator [Allobranchiibius sp. CTAmp26]|uniref:DeoR/GlpR family DNA-binding transcription regulator n=1 Tax=Allobranchiibius sp. CTAmp26 TaxID=2815214 RepID=UPI001AA138AB|nr:DeoR/GlpR family DNA-binding transcription regulator [Allobranchiibius sp. CTAmp26]MBO1753564.1 DeoR/GlpR transcriptional regulator [Allobranchiibius sp. CTAmp26]
MTTQGLSQRRDQVREEVLRAGYVRVEDLAQTHGVSLMTMHRDLDQLQEEGWITKIRGAATANPTALRDAGVTERSLSMSAEKAAIVREAGRLLGRGQTIFLDDSTTAVGLVPLLTAHVPITLATNFVPAMAMLSPSAGVEAKLLGGAYDPRLQSCSGLQTIDAIDALQADLLFMSPTGITGGRCVHRSEATVMVRRALLARSLRKVLLVDHAKFGRPATHVLCGIEAFDTIITDDRVAAEDLQLLRDRCADVRVASTDVDST